MLCARVAMSFLPAIVALRGIHDSLGPPCQCIPHGAYGLSGSCLGAASLSSCRLCVCVCVSVVLYGDRCAGVGLGKEDENDRRERPQTDIEAGFKNHLAPSLMDFSADRLYTSKHANSSPLNSSLLLSKALRRSLLLISMSV